MSVYVCVCMEGGRVRDGTQSIVCQRQLLLLLCVGVCVCQLLRDCLVITPCQLRAYAAAGVLSTKKPLLLLPPTGSSALPTHAHCCCCQSVDTNTLLLLLASAQA